MPTSNICKAGIAGINLSPKMNLTISAETASRIIAAGISAIRRIFTENDVTFVISSLFFFVYISDTKGTSMIIIGYRKNVKSCDVGSATW